MYFEDDEVQCKNLLVCYMKNGNVLPIPRNYRNNPTRSACQDGMYFDDDEKQCKNMLVCYIKNGNIFPIPRY